MSSQTKKPQGVVAGVITSLIFFTVSGMLFYSGITFKPEKKENT